MRNCQKLDLVFNYLILIEITMNTRWSVFLEKWKGYITSHDGYPQGCQFNNNRKFAHEHFQKCHFNAKKNLSRITLQR